MRTMASISCFGKLERGLYPPLLLWINHSRTYSVCFIKFKRVISRLYPKCCDFVFSLAPFFANPKEFDKLPFPCLWGDNSEKSLAVYTDPASAFPFDWAWVWLKYRTSYQHQAFAL